MLMTTMATKKDYICTVRARYQKAQTRKEKTTLINEVVQNLKKERKHVIKILNGTYYKKKYTRRKKRPEIYTYDLKKPLEQLWEVGGKPCSKNLKPQIPKLIKKLKQFDEIKLYPRQETLLCEMSTYVIDKLLRTKRNKLRGKGISGTKKSPLLKTLIPIRTTFDEINEPGHVEQDCVLHCGSSVAGTYAETLNTLDIETHWNEQTAFLKKTKSKVVGAFHEQRSRFPFKIKSIDFDNGYEFVNWAMHKYCKREEIDFTRSRPCKKNDQAHIEGKNYQSIRRVIGYDRIEDQKIVDLINDIYQNEFRLLNNFFYATQKLEEKIQVKEGKYRKKYGKAKTPYERVLESKKIDLEIKIKVVKQYTHLNPAELQRNLFIKIQRLKKMISVSKTNLATTP